VHLQAEGRGNDAHNDMPSGILMRLRELAPLEISQPQGVGSILNG